MNEIDDDLVIKGMRRFFKNLKEPGHRVTEDKKQVDSLMSGWS